MEPNRIAQLLLRKDTAEADFQGLFDEQKFSLTDIKGIRSALSSQLVHNREEVIAKGLESGALAKGKVGGSESGLVCVNDVRSMVRCMRARRAADEGA